MSRLHCVNIKKDQDVESALYDYVAGKNWTGALILAAVGSVYDVRLTNPISQDQPPQLLPIDLKVPCEIVSFNGEITPLTSLHEDLRHLSKHKSDYLIHIHAAVSCGSGVVNGGGLKGGKAWRDMNVYLTEFSESMN